MKTSVKYFELVVGP